MHLHKKKKKAAHAYLVEASRDVGAHEHGVLDFELSGEFSRVASVASTIPVVVVVAAVAVLLLVCLGLIELLL